MQNEQNMTKKSNAVEGILLQSLSNMTYYKCTKDKSYARYIREGSCLKAAPLTKNLKTREGIVKKIGRLGTTVVQNHLTRLEGKYV